MATSDVHAQDSAGYDATLCGFAYEGACLDGDDEEPIVADRGGMVTCERCRKIIAYCKTFKRNRQP